MSAKFSEANMATDPSQEIYSNIPPKRHRPAVLLVILAILLVGGYFYGQNFYQQVQKTLLAPPRSQRLEYQTAKVNHDPSALPEEFPQSLVLANATTLESYNLFFTKTNESKDGVLVMESSQNPDEIINYYQNLLKAPGYQFVKGSDATDTTSKKTLVYSTNTGIVVIKIETGLSGSKITITNSNILRGIELEQNAK